MTCSICGKPIDPNRPRNIYRRVTGWERVRGSTEGVHPLKGREYSDEFVHQLCLDIELRGGTPGVLAL